MSPRPYDMGKRQAAADETGKRIVAAAYELLTASSGVPGFTLEAVAKKAGVARMTVYYRFGTRRGLLEALFDEMAVKGGIYRMHEVFSRPDGVEALGAFIRVLAAFYDSDRTAMRRLRGIGSIDPEFGEVIEARNERRRLGSRMLVERIAQERGRPAPAQVPQAIDVLFALTGFEMFDQLATPTRDRETVCRVIQAMAHDALGLPPPAEFPQPVEPAVVPVPPGHGTER